MSQEPPSPPAGHPDPRTLRLFDLAPHEAILVRCECGRMAYATDVFWKVDLAKLFSIPVRAPVPVDQRGEARPAVGRQCRPENVLDAQIERQEGLGGDGRGGGCVDGARGPRSEEHKSEL